MKTDYVVDYELYLIFFDFDKLIAEIKYKFNEL